MSVQAPPLAPAALPPVPVRGTVAEAWRLLRQYPRLVLLPMYAVQVPVALVSAVVTLLLYFTVFANEPVMSPADLIDGGASGPLFAFLAMTAFEGLFAQVARGATITGVAAAANNRPETLPRLLDPAFSKMGGLLVLVLVQFAILMFGAVTIVGLPFALYALLRLDLSIEAYLLENTRPMGALRRSWVILKGSLWRFLGAMFLSALLVVIPFVAISSLTALVFGGRTAQLVTIAVTTLVQAILVVPLLAFFTAVTTLFYLRVKVRHDARLAARI